MSGIPHYRKARTDGATSAMSVFTDALTGRLQFGLSLYDYFDENEKWLFLTTESRNRVCFLGEKAKVRWPAKPAITGTLPGGKRRYKVRPVKSRLGSLPGDRTESLKRRRRRSGPKFKLPGDRK